MLLIVGLGNPGKEYERTRHNAGFMLVDLLSLSAGIKLEKKGRGLWGKGRLCGEEVVLLKPQTFMNLSGEAVSEARAFYKIPATSMIVAYDDCDLPLGKLRVRKDGGSGGHRGVNSIIASVGSREFQRIRLGIGRPPHNDTAGYVLTPFAKEEQGDLEEMLNRGKEAVELLITGGIDQAMNKFNP
ncbi:MAG: aminoacyl-tRNA hydrolase [Deltaproteobacteria bacterium]|nr:aminoacyl-tRNA hydrolase [Deltaproteobacteria bacterium]